MSKSRIQLKQVIEVTSSAAVSGLTVRTQDAILDIYVTNTDQASNVKRDPEKVLQSHVKEKKKKKYLRFCQHQQQAFTPFMMCVDGLLGQEAKNVLKQLSR